MWLFMYFCTHSCGDERKHPQHSAPDTADSLPPSVPSLLLWETLCAPLYLRVSPELETYKPVYTLTRVTHQTCKMGPGWVAQLVGVTSRLPKAYEFDFWSGHMTQVAGLIPSLGAYGRQPINVSLSHQCFFLSL